MSMTGFAASPGTAVDPTCSIRMAWSPNDSRIRAASAANRAGHAGSYGTMTIIVRDFDVVCAA
jgi:hypothetical protein